MPLLHRWDEIHKNRASRSVQQWSWAVWIQRSVDHRRSYSLLCVCLWLTACRVNGAVQRNLSHDTLRAIISLVWSRDLAPPAWCARVAFFLLLRGFGEIYTWQYTSRRLSFTRFQYIWLLPPATIRYDILCSMFARNWTSSQHGMETDRKIRKSITGKKTVQHKNEQAVGGQPPQYDPAPLLPLWAPKHLAPPSRPRLTTT